MSHFLVFHPGIFGLMIDLFLKSLQNLKLS